jgi:hypothetical protein
MCKSSDIDYEACFIMDTLSSLGGNNISVDVKNVYLKMWNYWHYKQHMISIRTCIPLQFGCNYYINFHKD